MNSKLEISSYYELLALHRAIIAAKFTRFPVDDRLSGSSILADISFRIVGALKELEAQRGHPERSQNWDMKITVNSEVWLIAIENALFTSDAWENMALENKWEFSKILLSPFKVKDEEIELFIEQVNQRIISKK